MFEMCGSITHDEGVSSLCLDWTGWSGMGQGGRGGTLTQKMLLAMKSTVSVQLSKKKITS